MNCNLGKLVIVKLKSELLSLKKMKVAINFSTFSALFAIT